ncbi:LOW QUALITY PROTEIN: hypothetical protein EUGRSUZ_C03639 [Eucalyptus grandis]|uniref:Uncharacterized protein n=1 Tax=Eucalyptus grandis TaxID=71139 RepID=A0ACC3LIN5_EUCGR|nr:LOW QUALITY PROTEIN: hypothetical protein EUGRSUZ_C03639 [Eucalyptus grandis]
MHQQPKLPLLSLNHVSFVFLAESVRFYERVLGFVLIKRPSSFNFEGAWLFNYGIGIHLLEVEDVPAKKRAINPKDSFQCSDMKLVMKKSEEMNIEYVTAVVEEGGIKVDQLFFHDLDGHMIEIRTATTCRFFPSSCPLKLPKTKKDPSRSTLYGKFENRSLDIQCAMEVTNHGQLGEEHVQHLDMSRI